MACAKVNSLKIVKINNKNGDESRNFNPRVKLYSSSVKHSNIHDIE